MHSISVVTTKSKNKLHIFLIAELTIIFKFFSSLGANSSPFFLSISRLRKTLCSTLSGASSPKSKT